MRHDIVVRAGALCAGLMLIAGCGGGGGGSGGSGGGASSSAPVNTAPKLTSVPAVTVFAGAAGTVYTASASDAEGNTITFSLTGTDAAKFAINASSGALSFVTAPSYTAPTDSDSDNEYLVTLNASDGTASSSMTLSVQIAYQAGGAYGWSNATWGGGGYVSGVLYHPTAANLLYARTDVGGIYRWDPAGKAWTALNDDLGRDDSQLTGIVSMAVDYNDPNKLFLAAGQYLPSWGRNGAILRSSDKGATWSRTELPIKLGGNSDGRGTGERLQVDPNKGSILFLGTSQDGLYKSSDFGVTWAKVPGFAPLATTFVMFDRSSASIGNATQIIYAGVTNAAGSGLLKSGDGGNTWAAVSGQPSGFMPQQAELDPNGNLFVTYADTLGPNGNTKGAVYRLNTQTSAWANITPAVPTVSVPFGYSGLALDPQNPGTLMVSTLDRWNTGDDIYRSADYGTTWTALNAKSTHIAPNNPWLTAYNGGTLSGKMGHWITDIAINPFNADEAIYNTGYGVWMSTNLTASGTIGWAFNNKDLEETVVLDVLSTRSGAHMLMVQGDVAGGRYTTLGAADTGGYFSEPSHTNTSIDAAELAPNIVVRLTDYAAAGGYLSSDNGVTWARIVASPVTSGNGPGAIAVSALGTSFVWTPRNQGAYYSSNNGASWTVATGWPTVPSGQYFMPVADRGVDKVFYTYDYTTGTIYESGNSGQSYASIITGLPMWNGGTVVSMPWKQRDLWIPTSAGLYHIDGVAASAVKVSSVQEAYLISYGAPAPGKTYHSLYLWGRVGGTVGIYRSDDTGVSWVRINDDKHQFGWINDMSGDSRVWGRVYLATGGRGLVVGSR